MAFRDRLVATSGRLMTESMERRLRELRSRLLVRSWDEPPRLLFFVPAERAAQIPSARPLAVRLSAELPSAECLALVPFARE